MSTTQTASPVTIPSDVDPYAWAFGYMRGSRVCLDIILNRVDEGSSDALKNWVIQELRREVARMKAVEVALDQDYARRRSRLLK